MLRTAIRALAGLGYLVFQHDKIDALRIDIAQAQFSGENRPHQFRPVFFSLGAQRAPLLDPRPAPRAGKRDGAHFEVNMVFIIHRDFENHHVSPLDHRIDHLAVDKINVRHAEEKSQILAVGIFDVAPDAPVGFFDGNNRIAKHDMVL